ncbi:MAG: oligosaccharide flippase family protein [Patescibacteria group bacterium]
MKKFIAQIERFVKTDISYLARGGFWLSANQVAVSLIGLGLAVGFANLLPKEVYGTYRYILSLAGILSAFALSGMGTAVAQAVARSFDGTVKAAFKSRLLWGQLVLLLALSGSAYYWFNNNYALAISLVFVGIFLPLIESGNLYYYLLIGKQYFKKLVVYEVIYRLITAVALLAAIFLTDDVIIVIAVYFITYALVSLLFFYKITRDHLVNNRVDFKSLQYGKRLSVVNVITDVAMYIDQIIIFHFLGAAQLAIYNFAFIVPQKIRGMIKPVSELALPKFTNREFKEIQKSLPRKLFFMLGGVIMMVGLYALIAPQLFLIFFPGYIDAVSFSRVGSLIIIGGLAPVIVSALHAHKKIVPISLINITQPIVKILLIIALGYWMGFWGIVISRVIDQWLRVGLYFVALKFSRS